MTLSIALRNAWHGKARVVFSILGVAVATLLVAFILALYRGWDEGLTTYIDETDAEIWVAPYGSESFFTPAFFSTGLMQLVQEVEGVQSITPMLYRPAKLRFEGDAWDTWVVGFTPDSPGGPVRLDSGSGVPGDGEIVIDHVLSRLSGADIGDMVDVNGNVLRITGISSGGNAVFTQISFISRDASIAQFRQAIEDAAVPADLAPNPETVVNVALVRTAPGEADAVAAEINRVVPGIGAFTSSEFAEGSSRALRQGMLPILIIILVIAFLVGTLVLGLTAYTSVIEKEHEFGVIRALGTPGQGLLRVVLEGALLSALAGFVLGVGLTFAAAALVTFIVPQFITAFRFADFGLVFGGIIVMTILAAIVPALRIIRVDAMTVFKA